MATGDRKVNIHTNRLLSKTALREQFLEYLSDKLDGTIAAFFQGQSGVLDKDTVGLAADGADRFKLDLTDADRVGVDTGQFITIPDEIDVSKSVPFENENLIDYHVGIRFNSVEYDQVEVNPRYGNPEYPSLMDSLGELGAPDAIVDTPGVKIQLQISGLMESGVDHSGRLVKVWLTTPVSGASAVAFYEGTSYYSGGENYVDIPYSGANGPLGQDTGSNPPSTTVGDYRCFIKGVTWRRNTDLSLDMTYAYLGKVQGAGAGNPPTVFDTDLQEPLLFISLEAAYHALGVGLGRRIDVTAGAVELNTKGVAVTADDSFAQLRLSRLGGTEKASFMLQLITSGTDSAIPLVILQPLEYTEMEIQEVVDQEAPNLVRFQRVGAQPDHASLRLNNNHHFLLLEDSPEAGLYGITGWGSDYIIVADLRTGSAPSPWTAGVSRKATVLTTRASFANGLPFPIVGYDDLHGFLLNLRTGSGTLSPLVITPEDVYGDLIVVRDNDYPASIGMRLRNHFAASDVLQKLEIRRNEGGDPKGPGLIVGCHPEKDADTQGVNFEALTARPAENESFYNRAIGWKNQYGQEVMRMDHLGRFSKSREFFDDFQYHVQNPYPYGAWNENSGGGLNTYFNWNVPSDSHVTSGGQVGIQVQGVNQWGTIWTPGHLPCFLEHAGASTIRRKLFFSTRFRILPDFTEGFGYLHMGVWLTFLGDWRIGARLDVPGAHTTEEFKVFCKSGFGTNESPGLGSPIVAGQYESDWMTFELAMDLDADEIAYSVDHASAAGPNGIGTIQFHPDNSIANWDGRPQATIYAECFHATADPEIEVDWIHVWDGYYRDGRKDRNS